MSNKTQAEVFDSEMTASRLVAQVTKEVISLSFEDWVFYI